jgi:hypothetical protein
LFDGNGRRERFQFQQTAQGAGFFRLLVDLLGIVLECLKVRIAASLLEFMHRLRIE